MLELYIFGALLAIAIILLGILIKVSENREGRKNNREKLN